MSELDQPLKLKHGLAAAVAIMAVSITGTAIAGGAGQKDAVRASAASADLQGTIHYRQVRERVRMQGNEQLSREVDCHRGERVVGGGVLSSAGFRGGGGMMISSSEPFDDGDPNVADDDGWYGAVDAFANAGGQLMVVTAVCVG
jgi:hypothetical protein